MKTDIENINRLFIEYLTEDISSENYKILMDWVNSHPEYQGLFNNLTKESYIDSDLSLLRKIDTNEDWKKIDSKLTAGRNRLFIHIARYAAVLILALGMIGLINYLINDKIVIETQIADNLVDIKPGRHKAILVLPGGKKIELEKVKDTVINTYAGSVIVNEQNIISYDKSNLKNKVAEWHTIKIPRGGEYKLKLCDGTVMWLNSDTEVRYQSVFTGEERQIYVSGEVFLDVTKNPDKPFVVNTANMDIKVLGTSFNVMAYADELHSSTTLVEGLVEISTKGRERKKVKLTPGKRAIIKEGIITTSKVNTKLYTSWKDSRLSFDNEPIESVVRKLSRWYDVEFFFMNESMKDNNFTGNIPKYENISGVLKMLEMTTNVKFRIKEKIVIIEEVK